MKSIVVEGGSRREQGEEGVRRESRGSREE